MVWVKTHQWVETSFLSWKSCLLPPPGIGLLHAGPKGDVVRRDKHVPRRGCGAPLRRARRSGVPDPGNIWSLGGELLRLYRVWGKHVFAVCWAQASWCPSIRAVVTQQQRALSSILFRFGQGGCLHVSALLRQGYSAGRDATHCQCSGSCASRRQY